MEPIVGSCLCKGVQYYIPSKSSQWLRCHCSMCRKTIGAEHCTFLAVPQAKVEFKSKKTLKTYKSSEEAERSFCSNCGCSITMKYVCEPNTLWFNASTLDSSPQVVDPHQIHYASKFQYLDVMSQADATPDAAAWVLDSAKNL